MVFHQGKNCSIADNAVIANNVILGDSVTIYPNIFIGPNTNIGDGSILYPGTQVGQNCKIGKKVELMKATLAGNVSIDDFAVVSDSGVHQFNRIGRGAFVAGGTPIRKDVPPWIVVAQKKGSVRPYFLNAVAARMKGNLEEETKIKIKESYKLLFSSECILSEGLAILRDQEDLACPEVSDIISFIEKSDRGIYIHKPILRTRQGNSSLKWIEPSNLYRNNKIYETKSK